MENQISLEGFSAVNGGDGVVTVGDVKESEDPENVILEDLDSYWEDINDRLTISRMVSDSVIKGMVTAVEQEATEKISQKELELARLKETELARLKETLRLYHIGVNGSESFGSVVMQHEPGSAEHGLYLSFSDATIDCDWNGESLGSLNKVVKEQLKNLKKEIDCIRGSSSIRRMGSGSEMVGLGGLLQDNVSDIKWMDVDKTLDSLKTALDTTFKQVDNLVNLSKTSLCQWLQEKEFQGEIEDMVIMNCIRSLKEEYEERLWDQNAQLYGNESINWLQKFQEISSLRQELDAISKSLTVPEIGHITSHGSVEMSEECDSSKRIDHLHLKILGNHVSLSGSHWEGNGKHDESVIAVPENLEFTQLKHMKKEELVTYFKTEMIKMKRNHEQEVQGMTEENFSLKREYLKLKERASLPAFKRDKEFDALRKKIPEVILKLDGILVENEKFPTFNENADGLCSLKDRFESLHSENRQLRGLLEDKKRDVKRLSSQVSDNAKIMLQHSLAEANLLKKIRDLQCALEDVQVEASITVDVYKCLLKDMVDSSKSVNGQSNTEFKIMQEVYEIIFSEAAQNAEPTNKCAIDDAELESIMMQELCGVVVFREALKEAEDKLTDLSRKYINEENIRASTEIKAQQKERALKLEVAEKERLKQEMLLLTSLKEDQEKLAKEAAAALVKEKEQLELIAQELKNLKDETSQQKVLISRSSKESNIIKSNLMEAMQQIELYTVEVHELKQKLELAMEELRNTNEEKRRLLSVAQEQQNAAALAEANERKHRKQMQSLIFIVHGLSKAFADYQYRVMEDINKSNLRLDNLSSQLVAVIQQANIVRRMGLMYKQRYSDLQKAEAEVDLLGDEVDALSSLLEKIYIALNHYSPILQHYPGIIEILKLIKRELSGESTKAV